MDREKVAELINKYLDGTCSPEERALVEQWYNNQIDEQDEFPLRNDIEETGRKIFKHLPVKKKKSKAILSYRSIAAAIFLVAMAFVANSLLQNDKSQIVSIDDTKQEIVPGGNKAYLTLEDGSKIILNEIEQGKALRQKGASVSKTEEGQLVYSINEDLLDGNDAISFNTISTPRGGQYQLVLPDGTTVVLNAESSLTYPTTFASLDERKVTLNGEAYFEVKHKENKPFRIHTTSEDSTLSQNVEVLGTHFNINAYGDEGMLKTTLIEGSVKVSTSQQHTILKPRQQSQIQKDNFVVAYVDPEAAVAWKNGYFMFDNEKIESIMHKIERWYDVEVVLQHVDKSQVFSGTVSKFENVSNVLNLLELTGGVDFEIQGKKIIVN